MDSMIHGFLDSWIRGFVGSWIHGFVDRGFVDRDLRIRGFVDSLIR